MIQKFVAGAQIRERCECHDCKKIYSLSDYLRGTTYLRMPRFKTQFYGFYYL